MNNLPLCVDYKSPYVSDTKTCQTLTPSTRYTKKVCKIDTKTFGYKCVYDNLSTLFKQ